MILLQPERNGRISCKTGGTSRRLIFYLPDVCASDHRRCTMLKIIRSLKELDFYRLMQVYEEGNRENGAERYSDLPGSQQLIQAEQDFYAYLREFFAAPQVLYAVWEADGRYAAALRLEPYQDGLLLEALETAPDLRRKGYAVSLIKAVLPVLEAQGYKAVYSHVHKKNKASLAVHAACGFQRILEHAVYIDGSVLHSSCTLCCRLKAK